VVRENTAKESIVQLYMCSNFLNHPACWFQIWFQMLILNVHYKLRFQMLVTNV